VGSRIPRTATNLIVALTALAWLIAVVLGQSAQAAYGLGFIPMRVSGVAIPFAAAPVWLTPLTSTLAPGRPVSIRVWMRAGSIGLPRAGAATRPERHCVDV